MAGVLGSEQHDRAGLRGGEVAHAWGRFEAEAAYGLRLSHGRGVLTPYAGTQLVIGARKTLAVTETGCEIFTPGVERRPAIKSA